MSKPIHLHTIHSHSASQDARERKIESIRVRIQGGTYKIEAADLAEVILRSMQQPLDLEGEGRAA